jgi:hypothetical protein
LHNTIVTEALDLSSAWLDFPLVAWKCSRMFQFFVRKNHCCTQSCYNCEQVQNAQGN